LTNGGFFVKTTVQYLDAVRKRLDLPSDYAAAKSLGVTRAAVSKYRLGLSTFDDTTSVRVAEILGIDAMEVIAASNFERAKDDSVRALWRGLWGKAAGTIATSLIVCAVGASAVVPSPVRASEQAESATLYLMSNRRRFRKATVWDSRAAA
jgi:predicted transcriptional regulator